MLENIIAHGNRGHVGFLVNSNITCADGFQLSVIAGGGTYCTPRPTLCLCSVGGESMPPALDGEVSHDYTGPYTRVEVMIRDGSKPWGENGDDVYGYVPVQKVRDLIAAHGGEQ